MEVVLLFGSVVGIVFAGTFLSRRRFGVLSLSLAAGSVLAAVWAERLTVELERLGLGIDWLPVGVVATIILLLLPMTLLLLSGPKHQSGWARFMAALGAGILTAAFLVQPLGKYMVLQGQALEIYKLLVESWHYVVTAGLVAGVMDLILVSSPKKNDTKKH